MYHCGCGTGSFSVVDSATLEDIVSFHHRKEEISDMKFSPGLRCILYSFQMFDCHV